MEITLDLAEENANDCIVGAGETQKIIIPQKPWSGRHSVVNMITSLL